ncbi:MAG: LysM peptidoglycan-binding domain-containing protein [Anaerolineales bacterium]|nr:LysM peptidoglycan-binding domain-containing protein [Anaerolineales bacterium]
MSPETASQKTKVCPTCGTRLSENATRCLVCGTELGSKPEAKAVKKMERTVQSSRMPEITLSLPAALGLLAIVLLIGAGGIYAALNAGGRVIEPTVVVTATETPTPSATPTETLPPTTIPTATLLPPFDYTINAGDTCGGIAFAFGINTQSIITLNNLPVACNNLVVGQVLKIPYPTPTALPLATNTLDPIAAAIIDCEKVDVTVQADQTLSGIALNYGVSMADIKEFNGLSTDNVFTGQTLKIPLCKRAGDPNKPTPTATIPPPYPAPNLLLPSDGAAFTLANDVVTLQWASVGTLRPGEAYQVTIEDATANQARRLTDFVTDTKYIVPTTFRPNDNVAHILRWWVAPVRQTGMDEQGQPIWVAAGSASNKHVFSWVGVAVEGTPSP